MSDKKHWNKDMAAGADGAATHGRGAAELLEDWVTIWQSELAGLVLDRELQEAMLRLVDGWAAQARAGLHALAPLLDGPHRSAGAVPATGAASAGAASAGRPADERDARIADLLGRVAELERQLAGAGGTSQGEPGRA